MISLLFAGDFCPQSRIAEMIEADDFSFLDEVRQFTRIADYSIVNLESPIADNNCKPILKSGPSLRSTSKVLEAIRYAGFDGVTLANNHFKDYGEQSVLKTIEAIDSYSLDRVGGGRTLDDSKKPLIIRIKGKTIAIINSCEREFSIATKYSAGSSPLDLIDNQRSIAECRSLADFVIMIIHGGHELHQLPSPMMQKTYRWFIDMGADVVINHHQHCFSGFELYNNKPIFYGLGNFCFDKPKFRNSLWNEGYLLSLNINEQSDGIAYNIIPYLQCNDLPRVQIMEGRVAEEFFHSIAALNNIIADPMLVEIDFDRYCKHLKKRVLGLFSPFSNRYLRGAAQKGIIPFMLPRKKVVQIYDHIACDAHRNIVLNCLEDTIECY